MRSQTPPPAPGPAPAEGLSQAEALEAAGYPGNAANAARDLKLQGSSPAEFLRERGWQQQGRKWSRG